MAFLRWLEGIRNPFLDAFFSTVTHLGEETFFILLGLVFFWCVSKKEGYYLLSIGFIGTVINQFLKLYFRIERPWVKDKNFTIVESARGEATGYSFPSGHTQSSVGIFGGIARFNGNRWLRTMCIAICILVPLSRLYLGVHTPLDVGVSLLVAVILIFGLYPIIQKGFQNVRVLRATLLSTVFLALGYLCFVLLYNFPNDVDLSNLENGTENAYKMLGCTLGIYISFEIDNRFIRFETEAVWWAQILKLVIGIIPIVAIKAGLKAPLYAILGKSFLADGVRYLLIVLFAGCLWPMTFKYFSKLGNKTK